MRNDDSKPPLPPPPEPEILREAIRRALKNAGVPDADDLDINVRNLGDAPPGAPEEGPPGMPPFMVGRIGSAEGLAPPPWHPHYPEYLRYMESFQDWRRQQNTTWARIRQTGIRRTLGRIVAGSWTGALAGLFSATLFRRPDVVRFSMCPGCGGPVLHLMWSGPAAASIKIHVSLPSGGHGGEEDDLEPPEILRAASAREEDSERPDTGSPDGRDHERERKAPRDTPEVHRPDSSELDPEPPGAGPSPLPMSPPTGEA